MVVTLGGFYQERQFAPVVIRRSDTVSEGVREYDGGMDAQTAHLVDTVIPKLITESSRLNSVTSEFMAERGWLPVVLMTTAVAVTAILVTVGMT